MAAAPASRLKESSSPKDWFGLFGLKRRFGVDRAALERKFYELSRASHPDRFTLAGPEAQAQALERMSELNEAYRTLKDPLKLRQHYLELEGMDAQTLATADQPKTGIPMELTEVWFELQDALMEDPGSAPVRIAAFENELARMREKGGEKLASIESAIDQACDSIPDSNGAAPRELLDRLAHEIRAQSYLKSMERDVERIKKRI